MVPPQDEDDNTTSPRRDRSLETMPQQELEPQQRNERAQPPASGSASPVEFRVHKHAGCMDAATQTDDLGRRTPELRKKSLRSTDHDAVVREVTECWQRQGHPCRSADLPGVSREELLHQSTTPPSTPSTRGKSASLESLIRADNATSSFRILEEEEEEEEEAIVVPSSCPKLKPTNVLVQLISCGSLSVKGHEDAAGPVRAYKPRLPSMKLPSPFVSRAMAMGELDHLSENPSRLVGVRLEEKEYFSGSLVETKTQRDGPAQRYSALKRSSSYNAERERYASVLCC